MSNFSLYVYWCSKCHANTGHSMIGVWWRWRCISCGCKDVISL